MSSGPTNPTRRPPFFFGPGTLIALVMIAVLFAIRGVDEHQPPPADHSKGQSAKLSTGRQQGPTPEVSFLLENSRTLELTHTQASRIQTLVNEEQAKQKAIDQKLGNIQNRATSPEKENGATISAIDPEFAKLYKEKRSITESYWTKAQAMLTKKQKKTVEELRIKQYQKLMENLGVDGKQR
ncbi:MAG: hypothetical protein IT209_10730 [Armatimonadetes bacterium]|nr:hypothetical protein [Armatimonadota bacterium]